MKMISLFITITLMLSCSEKNSNSEPKQKEDNIIPVVDFIYKDNVDEFLLEELATDDDGDILSYQWSCDSESIFFSNANSTSTTFEIPDFGEEKDVVITLTVTDGIDTVKCNKTISIPKLTESRIWGLGSNITAEVSNDVEYEWYIDQGNTGTHSDFNCGPASVTMAAKWVYPNFSSTCQDARDTYHPDGGWWYASDITSYLNSSNVNNQTISLTKIEVLKEQLDAGNIVIINPDMYYIRSAKKDKHRVDRFYDANGPKWGHYVIAKGYKIVDGNTFYEIYDPYGFNKTNNDGTPKGINRYYRAEDIDKTTNIWWDYAIVISKSM